MKRLSLLFVLAVSPCFAQGVGQKLPGATDAQLDQRILDQIAAPITNRAALDGYVRNLPPQSPLLSLPKDARQAFLDSLVFTERGLASYRYVPLQGIDAAHAYRVLALFGVQGSLAAVPGMSARSEEGRLVRAAESKDPMLIDYPGYACASKATCTGSHSSICIGNNC